MTTRRGDLAITTEGWAAAAEKQRAERAAVPQLAAIDQAMEHTKDERAEIEGAEAALRQAEEAVHAFMVDLPREPGALGFVGSNLDLEELRLRAQNLRRRLNATVQRVNAARAERRRAAKEKFTPRPEAKAKAATRLSLFRKRGA